MGLKNLGTPQHLFDEINREFDLDLDVCAEEWSAKLPDYCSLPNRNLFDEDLKGRKVWCNPPFSSAIPLILEYIIPRATICVCMLNASVSSQWFHQIVLPRASSLDFFQGRISFDYPPGVDNPRRPDTDCMLAIFHQAPPQLGLKIERRCGKTGARL